MVVELGVSGMIIDFDFGHALAFPLGFPPAEGSGREGAGSDIENEMGFPGTIWDIECGQVVLLLPLTDRSVVIVGADLHVLFPGTLCNILECGHVVLLFEDGWRVGNVSG